MKRNIKSIFKFAILSAITVVFTVLLYRLIRKNYVYDLNKLALTNLQETVVKVSIDSCIKLKSYLMSELFIGI